MRNSESVTSARSRSSVWGSWHSVAVRAVLVGISVVFLAVAQVFAQEVSSPSFRTQDSIINSFGGTGTSTSFESIIAESEIESIQATSTNFIVEMGPMNFEAARFATQNWRWYDDAENETPSTALATENTAPIDIEDQDVVALRITVAELDGYGMIGPKMSLQYSTSSDFSASVYEVAPQYACSGSSWCYANGGGVDSALISTALLTDADACSGGIGAGCGTHNENATSSSSEMHEAGAVAEYAFTIRQSGAAINTVYFFRLVERVSSTTISLNTGETYPSVVTGGSSLSFSIQGLETGTTTEGVTTDITTTPTSIPFGTLPDNVSIEGAQRLVVSTNGTAGYRVHLYERQSLEAEGGARIQAVDGTNENPAGWTSGCTGFLSCFGYHSGDDLLDGVSQTRFAADDTYAEATSTPHTVAYHSGPVSGQTTDIVYKIETRTGQDNGNYASSVVYIIAPIF